MSRLTQLTIEVTPNDNTAVSFALLQGHLRDILPTSEQMTAFKMDLVLFELYTQFYSLQSQVLEGNQQMKVALLECSEVMENCRDDRQEVFRLSEDRLRLVRELKQATDQALDLLQQNEVARREKEQAREENEKMRAMLGAYEDLNSLLNTRHAQMELQLTKLAKNEGVKDSVKLLQTEYSSILSDNLAIQKEMEQLGQQTAKFQEFALPIRVINLAFTSNKSLRELVMRQAEIELGVNPELRELFMGFSFELGE